MSCSAFASGKFILSGEHSVVYGHPAIAIPTSLGITVRIEEKSALRKMQADGNRPLQDDERVAQAIDILLSRHSNPVNFHNEYDLQIDSTLPTGKGLGSSAALSIALIRAMYTLSNKDLTLEQLLEEAHEIECIFHGTPSGIDHTVSAVRQAICFNRLEKGIQWSEIMLPELTFLIVDSGTIGSTSKMVQQVRLNHTRSDIQHTLQQMGQLTHEIKALLQDTKLYAPQKLGELMTRNHALLQNLEVSTPSLDRIVEQALQQGAWGAKLSGSGGGGIVTVFGENLPALSRYFEAQGLDCYTVHYPLDATNP